MTNRNFDDNSLKCILKYTDFESVVRLTKNDFTGNFSYDNNAFDSEVYTDVYVTLSSVKDINCFSDEYENKLI